MSFMTPRRPAQSPRLSFNTFKKEKNVTQPTSPRLSSSSPRFSKSFKLENNKSPIRVTSIVPEECRNPEIVQKEYVTLLTQYELFEISKYPQIYYLGRMCQKVRPNKSLQHNLGFDDRENNLIIKNGDHIAYQYKVLSIMGHSENAVTTLCYDFAAKENVVLKVYANNESMKKQTELEIKSFEMVHQSDCEHIVKCRNSFVFRGHICLAFEVLGANVASIIKNEPDAATKEFIRTTAVSLFTGVCECHRNNVVHRKVNLRNLLVDPMKRGSFKLSDFDNCIFQGEGRNASKRLTEKAPEELLDRKSPLDAIDIWGCGLCLCYMSLGTHIFRGRNVREVFDSIVSVFGEPPEGFDKECAKYDLLTPANEENEEEEEVQKHVIPRRDLYSLLNDSELVDLVTKCLQWRGEDRISAEEALEHPFLKPKKLPPLKR